MVAETQPSTSNGSTTRRKTQEATDNNARKPLLRLVSSKRSNLSLSNHYTDLGNATYMAQRHGQDIKYVPTWGVWLVWDGTRWAKDETGYILELAKDTILSMWTEAGSVKPERRADYVKHVLKSESANALHSMLALVQTMPEIAAHYEALDADDMLFNCQNGTLDLRTGKLRLHNRADLITKIAPVAYNSTATAPKWGEFLDTIMCGDADLVQFLQEAIGVSLSGDTSDEVFIVLHGAQGANGKSTFLEGVRALLGEYGQSAPVSTFIRSKNSGINNDIARLIGVRFCSASETEEGQHLADSLIKQLTGGDTMSARFLHHEFFDFKPKATLFLATNHRPQVRNGDNGLWRRMRLVPFRHSFEKAEGGPTDKSIILEGFKQEMSGILNWALAGWMSRQARGRICFPDSMRVATDDYRRSMDMIGLFLEECTVRHPQAKVAAKELYLAYKAWCDANGEQRARDNALFSEHLIQQLGFERLRRSSGNFYLGIGMRSEYDDVPDPTPPSPEPPPTPIQPELAALMAPMITDVVHMAPVSVQVEQESSLVSEARQKYPKPTEDILCPSCHTQCQDFKSTIAPLGYACPSCLHQFLPIRRRNGSIERWM